MAENSDHGAAPVALEWGTLPPFRLKLHERTDQFVSNDIRRFKVWEPFETSVVLAFLAPGGTFLDIGANIGWYSIVAGLTVGAAGRAIAFEPDPLNFSLLRENAALNALANIELVNKAASDRDGRGLLFLSPDNLGDHRLFPAVEQRHSVAIETIRVDSFFGHQPPAIDVVKMDCQGAEGHIVAGMRETLNHSANAGRTPLVMEFWPHGLRGAGTAPDALIDTLEAMATIACLIDEQSATLIPIAWPDLRRRAAGDLHPDTQHFVNILVTPRGRALPPALAERVAAL